MSVRKARAATQTAREIWWMEGADVDCLHCSQGYAYEREVHCMECDTPMCPLCMQRIEMRIICPACKAELDT